MDLVNDLSNDLALAFFVDGTLARKLPAQDAKSFIARIEAELCRISKDSQGAARSSVATGRSVDLSH
jgi:hypothetical protein